MGAVSGHNWFHPCIHSNWVLALLKLAGVSYMLGASYLLAVCCLVWDSFGSSPCFPYIPLQGWPSSFTAEKGQSSRESRSLRDYALQYTYMRSISSTIFYACCQSKDKASPDVQIEKQILPLKKSTSKVILQRSWTQGERSRAAAIFAVDRPNTGIYFFNTIPCYFMKLSQ